MSNVSRRVMRLRDVMHMSGLGRSSIYNYMSKGKFPKCWPLGGGIVGWDSLEVQRWVDAVLDGREWKPLEPDKASENEKGTG
ncbi:AlpA family phage regulatory protein [Pseudomonas nitroreducens]|uniref:helix-turn-helix transcriptional regulator n=1 Tax=Pseudomonas nitroreducens TaxID=46680 RepID=UPI00244C5E0F|nr:AlpA family phage regulatory protein [Pseudomonas nitroreducens]MDH1077275.1 AlpA family phage regulatory protein [Pseudomonas nitroreducens]